ncbi:phosphoglycerate mutase-like protein [Pluteus cervinus]|uniref:Phosphoglycerate mutase-like protein n=1 Tax=Pluteus cervinus TaxID=181527 RepID=A0ACD3AMJ7_9AGAR|nr:phosphoglycerate mutase-like protein [Pluteus cervinus]
MRLSQEQDVEGGGFRPFNSRLSSEQEALLPASHKDDEDAISTPKDSRKSHIFSDVKVPRFDYTHVGLAFVAGILSLFLVQLGICGTHCFSASQSGGTKITLGADILAAPDAGSTSVDQFPPPSPTNAYPSLFPTNVGYPGGTATGAEPGSIQTAPAYPVHSGAPHLSVPAGSGGSQKGLGSDLFKLWGNLSPWYSVGKKTFGLDSDPGTPQQCSVTGLHFLHRHGARYPTAWASYGGPANFSGRLNNVAQHWTGSADLEFMNNWTYKLGEELLTPFGRQQMYDLGVSMRIKYGFLLKDFTDTKTLPVFRTESQDRMLHSALNFAIGFFGYPFEGQYQQLITIEADGFNNTLAPYSTCKNASNKKKSERAWYFVRRWAAKYLDAARARLQPQLQGFTLTVEDVYTMQQMCAYETVALGYSKFCPLFTLEEWEGFDYALDLAFWYNNAFGSPVARVQGIGYVQEMLARLTHTPLKDHTTSTNKTIHDNPVTFPLNQSLYVDATHEVVVLNIITALNLTRFSEDGPLPDDHIPRHRKFRVSELAPFGTNVQFQLLTCTDRSGPQIRVVINDGVAPLTGIRGCPEDKDGLCPVDTFVKAQQEIVAKTDWRWGCDGDWEVPEGPEWDTVTGDPPDKKYSVSGSWI